MDALVNKLLRGHKMKSDGFTIGICDDDAECRLRVERLIRKMYDEKEVSVVHFGDGESVCNYKDSLDILILDIEMNGINGIYVKNAFYDKNTIIIFLTAYGEYVKEGYGLNVIGFVEKNELGGKLKFYIDKAEKLIDRYTMIFDEIDSRDVRLIRADGKYVRFLLEKGYTRLYENSIKALTEGLKPYDFIQIRRNIIVNLKWIDRVNKDNNGRSVKIIIGDNEVPVSYRKTKSFQESYDLYCRRKARFV